MFSWKKKNVVLADAYISHQFLMIIYLTSFSLMYIRLINPINSKSLLLATIYKLNTDIDTTRKLAEFRWKKINRNLLRDFQRHSGEWPILIFIGILPECSYENRQKKFVRKFRQNNDEITREIYNCYATILIGLNFK